MASSDVARFLMKQYSSSLAKEDNSRSSDPILGRFKTIGKILYAKCPALANPESESISWLSDLNDALTEWRILKEPNKSIKRIFRCHDHEAHINDFNARLDKIQKSLEDASISTESSQPNLLQLDRCTFYKPDRSTCVEDEVSDKHEKGMVDWLLMPGHDFKAIGICGMGCSGKTALVKNVLKRKTVGDKFKHIIWACLSDLIACEEGIDVRIIKYLLYRLGLDIDSLVDNVDQDMDWLVKELVRQFLNYRDYILVLDDMWYCSEWFADHFLGELKKNGGGAVIVTSRKKTVAEKIGEKGRLVIHLNPPDDKESARRQTNQSVNLSEF